MVRLAAQPEPVALDNIVHMQVSYLVVILFHVSELIEADPWSSCAHRDYAQAQLQHLPELRD